MTEPTQEQEPVVGKKRAKRALKAAPKHTNDSYKLALQIGLQPRSQGTKVEEVVVPSNRKELTVKAKEIAKTENRNMNVVLRELMSTEYVEEQYGKVPVYPVNRAAKRANQTNITKIEINGETMEVNPFIKKFAELVAKHRALKVKNRFPGAPITAIQEVANRAYNKTVIKLKG